MLTQPDPNIRIPAARVRALCGGISDMSLWRWLNEPSHKFPKPIYIGTRRYWREVDVLNWLDAQEASIQGDGSDCNDGNLNGVVA